MPLPKHPACVQGEGGRQREIDRDRDKEIETDRDRQRQTETDRQTARQTETDRDRDREGGRERYARADRSYGGHCPEKK